MAFLLGRPQEEIPTGKRARARAYVREYRSFFTTFGGCDSRQVDKSLWSFGKFLGSSWGGLLRRKAELLRRAADDDANPDDVIPLDQVKANLRARFGP
jgi:hypothetical protein